MTDRRLIGDILSERRRDLGLSIERVVNDTRLQRRMIEAYEDSDFDAMPPKGYAQASLASYARYLGLNPNEILRAYEDQLYEYQEQAYPQQRDVRSRAEQRRRSDYAGERGAPGGGRPQSRASSAARRDDRRYPRGEGRPSADQGGYPRGGRGGRDYGDAGDWRGEGGGRPDRRDYRQPAPAPSSRRGYASQPGGYAGYRDGAEPRDGADPRDDRYPERSDRSDRYAPVMRSRNRGLYDSGHRREDPQPSRREGPSYLSSRDAGPSSGRRRGRTDERDAYSRYPADDYPQAGEPRGRRGLERRGQGGRGEIQIVNLDDGYEGGSGGPNVQGRESFSLRSHQRPPEPQRESIFDVALGWLDTFRRDRRTFGFIVAILAGTVVIISAVAIGSCVRSSNGADESGTIPVTSVTSTDVGVSSELAPSVDLGAIPADSVLAVYVGADALSSPWVEVYVDDVAVYAAITNPGASLTWTVTQNATVKLSSTDNVAVTVNGTQVVPVLESGTYTLTMTVAP